MIHGIFEEDPFMHNIAVVKKYPELFIARLRNINDHVFVTIDENSRKSLISLK